ncbi:MAG: multiprotein bridging factor aMBF1 [Candidatus Bathyarchaeia archaeon]
MQCEVCGREIIGKPHRVIIEGAKMVTCGECARLGSDYWIPEKKTLQEIKPSLRKTVKSVADIRRESHGGSFSRSIPSEGFEITEGFGLIVKKAREKLGLTPEDLGKKIGEKESVIKKIESEKMVPDFRLATKLERALRIKLLTKPSEPELDKPVSVIEREKTVTIGEIVNLRSGKRRRLKDEGDNSIS